VDLAAHLPELAVAAALVPAGLWLAVAHPIAFFCLLLIFLVGAVLLARMIWRGLRRLLET
jgi:hypothetical protein